jgi:hypothetical protein
VLECGVCIQSYHYPAVIVHLLVVTDSHFRIGGAAGTDLQLKDCPAKSGSVKTSCIAGTMMLHLTPSSSAYLENIWAWVADHDIDNAAGADAFLDIYVARGTGNSRFCTLLTNRIRHSR